MNLENFNNRVAIIGLGFMGIALAKSFKKMDKVVIEGYDVNNNMSSLLLKKRIIHKTSNNLLDLVKNNDLIFLTVPVSIIPNVVWNIKNELDRQILIDFGSTKNNVFLSMQEVMGNRIKLYVPCHPICGGRSINFNTDLNIEIDRVNDNIFKNHLIHFFPKNSDTNNRKTVEKIFNGFGAIIDNDLDLEKHDLIYGLTSHLPMFLSVIFLNSIDNSHNGICEYFKEKMLDTMWSSVFFENIKNIEFWINEVLNRAGMVEKITVFNLSMALKMIVEENKFQKYAGNGYFKFVENINNNIYCKNNDFIKNKDELIRICKNRDIDNLNKKLTKIYNGC